jgi:uncharacterized OsmC-like protein/alpha/beta superfamily hydrolase
MPIKTLRVRFPGARGQLLSGRIDMPVSGAKSWALFAHCFTCSKDLYATKRISETLAHHGIAVLRFDFTGLGESEGDFAGTTFSSDIDDLVAAADWLRSEHGPPALMIGHSLGGAATLTAAHRVPDCLAVATLAAPFDPAHVAHLFSEQADELAAQGEAQVNIGGRPFTVRQSLVDDLNQQDPSQVAALRRPLLVMHAPLDNVVGIDNARQLYVAARHPKSFICLDEADHLLSNPRDAIYAADVLVAWSARYLNTSHEHDDRKPLSDAVVRVVPSGEGTLDHDITVGPHIMRADEPVTLGGLNTGPAPYDLLLASLGACTAMTIRMYAERKGWTLDGAEVSLTHAKVDGVDHINRQVTLRGRLDDEQRARLMQIANRCPVHRTLHGTIEVVTEEIK